MNYENVLKTGKKMKNEEKIIQKLISLFADANEKDDMKFTREFNRFAPKLSPQGLKLLMTLIIEKTDKVLTPSNMVAV
jgi:esterase/lipase